MSRRRKLILMLAIIILAPIAISGLVLGVLKAEREANERFEHQMQLRRNEWVSKTKKALHTRRQSEIPFYSTEHTDTMIREFAGMPEVRSLTFELTDLSDAGMQDVAGLPNLESLTIYGGKPRVGNDGLRCLSGRQNIKKLVLVNIDVTDDGFEILTSLPALADLTLYRDSYREICLTDAALEHLKKLTGLKKLNISGGWMSDTAMDELRKTLPNCKVATDSPFP